MQISTPELIRERSDQYQKQMDSVNPKSAGYTMSNKVWPGLAKLIEEAGEVTQACGKILACGGGKTYWDGRDLVEPLEEELADLLTAMDYVIIENGLNEKAIQDRYNQKTARYYEWKAANQ